MNAQESKRERQYYEMLKAALKQPGVNEASELLEKWQAIDNNFARPNDSTSESITVTTTSSNDPL